MIAMSLILKWLKVICSKGNGECLSINSITQAKGCIEEIYVENVEYQAWGSLGRRLGLSVERKINNHWLKVTCLSDHEDPFLKNLLISCLEKQSVKIVTDIALKNFTPLLPQNWAYFRRWFFLPAFFPS